MSFPNMLIALVAGLFSLTAFAVDHHRVHEDHDHVHGFMCGHQRVLHLDHIDYMHRGHAHHFHGGHWHECRAVRGSSSAEHHGVHEGHSHRHHGRCGHEARIHEDHLDFNHDGHWHHWHAGHWHECE